MKKELKDSEEKKRNLEWAEWNVGKRVLETDVITFVTYSSVSQPL
jgi:hypothetical protein